MRRGKGCNIFVYSFLIALILLKSTVALSQNQSFRFDRLTIEDGLPNPSVLNIIQDDKGFIWIASFMGIARYDGIEMKTYFPTSEKNEDIKNRDVQVLFTDSKGGVWLGVVKPAAKLYKYQAQFDRFVPCLYNPDAEEQIIKYGVSSIQEDDNGHLVVATYGSGLLLLDLNKDIPLSQIPFEQLKHIEGDDESLPINDLEPGMTKDTEGNIWIPSVHGISRFDAETKKFKTFTFSKDTTWNANFCLNIEADKNGNIWIPTYDEGLVKYDSKVDSFSYYLHDKAAPFSIKTDIVYNANFDAQGKLWLGLNGGLDIFNPTTEKFAHINTGESKGAANGHLNGIYSFFTDYSGNIWTGLWQKGILKHNPDKEHFYFTKPLQELQGDNNWVINEIIEGENGIFWIGTAQNGLVEWNKKLNTFRFFKHDENQNSIGHNSVRNLFYDKSGNVWIGHEKGLDKFDIKKGIFKHFLSIPNAYFPKVFHEDDEGKKWMSVFGRTFGYIEEGQSTDFQIFPTGKAAKTYLSSTVSMTPDSCFLWVGINQQGLYSINLNTGEYKDYIYDYGVHDIHFDREGKCWLSTHSNGLQLFDTQTGDLIPLSGKEKEYLSYTRTILEDDKGYLWILTPSGIVKYDPFNKKTLAHFNKTNWVEGDKDWYRNTFGFRTSSGEMAFKSSEGILFFHPDSIQIDTIPPKIAFTYFKISNKEIQPGIKSFLKQHISYTNKIKLNYNQNNLTIGFAALHFKNPKDNQYAYFLENYEKTWQYVGTKHQANYTNLSPGKYILRVKASNSDGVWNEEGIALQLIILSPWWATFWAYLFYAFIGIALLYFFYNFQLKRKLAAAETHRLQELNELKTRLYTNITHEFRTPLTIILGMADELVHRVTESGKDGLDMIKRNGQQLLRLVNRMLDLSKLESGHLKLEMVQADVIQYLRYLVESFHSLAESKQIQLQFETKVKELKMDFEPDRLQEILSNLISNAIKFTDNNGIVNIKINQINRNLQVVVEDNGRGIPASKLPKIFDRFYQVDGSGIRQTQGTGIGLSLTSELIKLMKGQIEVQSVLGKGSIFSFVLPVTQKAVIKQSLFPKKTKMIIPPLSEWGRGEVENKEEKPLILIIEDNADVVSYLYSCLGQHYEIEVARDGKEGIEKALKLIPNLIISDVMMPYIDGFEVCQTLKKDQRTSHIPIVILTAKADVESKLQGLLGGADAYLPKPFHKNELLIRIKKLLELRLKLQTYYLSITEPSAADTADMLTNPMSAIEEIEHQFIQNIRKVINEHIDDASFSVDNLCDEIALSRSTLHRKITALTGYSARRYINFIRLTKAKQLLSEQPDMTIAAVAYDIGFSDPDYFSKVFKNEFGMTPSAFRNT